MPGLPARTPEEGVAFCAAAVERLREAVGIEPSFQALGIDEGAFLDALPRQALNAFADALRERGVTVHYLAGLLTETLPRPAARALVHDRVFDERDFGPLSTDRLRAAFDAVDPAELTRCLIGGVAKRELTPRLGTVRSARLHAMAPDDFALAPLSDHLFTLDTSCRVYDGVSVNPMRERARRRETVHFETVHFEAIYRHHPLFEKQEFRPWSGGQADHPSAIEGGDVLVISNGAVPAGMSERTTPQAVEAPALRCSRPVPPGASWPW
ncbi:arginine deiminase family protein [Streptomyces roseoverticillatus]|uniref:arginine deiminase family protein n=1 Tax=Streptomyces roseoverticillatus TaxID=66429 RepID=UPI0033D82602